MPVVSFVAKDGSERFTCVDCGSAVLAALPNIRYEDKDSVCMVCRFIRNNPSLKQDTINMLRPSR